MERNITIPSPHGQLKAVYSDTGKGSVLILCHGIGSSMDHPTIRGIAERVNQAGWSILRFTHTQSIRLDTLSRFSLARQVAETKAVIDFLAAEHRDCILVGGSLAGIDVIIAAEKDSRVRGVITLNGLFYPRLLRWQRWIAQLSAFFSPGLRQSFAWYQQHFHPERLTIPVLLIHATGDRRLSAEQSKLVHQALPSATIRLISGGDHRFSTTEQMDVVAQQVVTWLTEQHSSLMRAN